MANLNNPAHVVPMIKEHVTVWRLIEHAHEVDPADIGSGIVEYPKPQNGQDPDLRGAHEHSEFYYVIDGTGFLLDETERVALKPGDGFSITGGRRHTLWADTDKPLRCFYVALLPKGEVSA